MWKSIVTGGSDHFHHRCLRQRGTPEHLWRQSLTVQLCLRYILRFRPVVLTRTTWEQWKKKISDLRPQNLFHLFINSGIWIYKHSKWFWGSGFKDHILEILPEIQMDRYKTRAEAYKIWNKCLHKIYACKKKEIIGENSLKRFYKETFIYFLPSWLLHILSIWRKIEKTNPWEDTHLLENELVEFWKCKD